MTADARDLGRRIAERRRALRLTQEELAERANVNLKSVQGAEQARTEPELRTVRRIAKALDTTIDALVGDERSPTPMSPRDATIRKIEADLRRCSPRVVRHVAALVRALASAASRRPT